MYWDGIQYSKEKIHSNSRENWILCLQQKKFKSGSDLSKVCSCSIGILSWSIYINNTTGNWINNFMHFIKLKGSSSCIFALRKISECIITIGIVINETKKNWLKFNVKELSVNRKCLKIWYKSLLALLFRVLEGQEASAMRLVAMWSAASKSLIIMVDCSTVKLQLSNFPQSNSGSMLFW